MAATQHHEPHACRKRFPEQIAGERPRLTIRLGGLLSVVSGVDHDAEHGTGVGRCEST